MNTFDVVKLVIKRNSDLDALNLVPISSSFFVQSVLKDGVAQDQVNVALTIRDKHKFPFWDALCSVLIDNDRYSKSLLSKVLHHNNNDTLLSVLPNDFFEVAKNLEAGKQYAISSRVTMADGRICHIPMIDFHCNVNQSNEQLVADVISEINVGPGFVLNSGRSYHFIGSTLIEEADLSAFMGRLIMFNPIIDKAWVAHQLIEGYCALRITKKYDILPEVVREIDVPETTNR
jgi:hypothetical protein